MTHPILALICDAQSLAPRALTYQPGRGPSPDALTLRTRIGTALALLEAAEAAQHLDPTARAKIAAIRARIAHLPRVWESAFGYAWEDGRVLKRHEHTPSPAGRAMREDVHPTFVLDPRDRLDRYPPWQAARAVCLAIRTDGERAAQAELEQRRVDFTVRMRRYHQEEAIRVARRREAAQRRAQAERRRQARELHEFRTGTQRRVRFPNERGQRARQKVRSR